MNRFFCILTISIPFFSMVMFLSSCSTEVNSPQEYAYIEAYSCTNFNSAVQFTLEYDDYRDSFISTTSNHHQFQVPFNLPTMAVLSISYQDSTGLFVNSRQMFLFVDSPKSYLMNLGTYDNCLYDQEPQ